MAAPAAGRRGIVVRPRWMVLCVLCASWSVSSSLAASSTPLASAGARPFVSVEPLVRGHPWQAFGRHEDAEFGYSVASAGDVNGDGYADVIVGAPRYEYQSLVQGRAYVYYGSSAGLSSLPDWRVSGFEDWGWFGGAVASAGDVNGDGFDDVIVGAPDTYATEVGQAYVYYGSAEGLNATANWAAEGDQGGDQFGGSVGSAGDINGDGFGDIVVGSPRYGEDECGVDVGERPSHGDQLCDQGRAFVYYGSAAGPSIAPDWVTEGDQSLAYYGTSVGTAGDVNGDGYADVIVGSPWYSNGEPFEGRAFVFLGSAAGLSTSPEWLAEGNNFLAHLGDSVGTAGDVNADSYDDVIVGAPYAGGSLEGRAFVYLGSAAGLHSLAIWQAEGKSGDGYFGHAVGAAGDVNGDGYDDVIVGAYLSSHGEAGEGRAYVFNGGSASGVSTTADWGTEGDQEDAYLAYSVAGAGDVNGDGYAEIMIGAYLYDHHLVNVGAVFVYPGRPKP